MSRKYEAVLEFWIGDAATDDEVARQKAVLWWEKHPENDCLISERFGALREDAIAGRLDKWAATARGRLALIVLVDQFSRNIHRGRPDAFRHDALARQWTQDGVAAGMDRKLGLIERLFFYLPLEHSEALADQQRSVELFAGMARRAPPAQREALAGYVEFARQHHDIIARFGRFPHRNAILGRESTEEEKLFLAGPGSAF